MTAKKERELTDDERLVIMAEMAHTLAMRNVRTLRLVTDDDKTIMVYIVPVEGGQDVHS